MSIIEKILIKRLPKDIIEFIIRPMLRSGDAETLRRAMMEHKNTLDETNMAIARGNSKLPLRTEQQDLLELFSCFEIEVYCNMINPPVVIPMSPTEVRAKCWAQSGVGFRPTLRRKYCT